ncbi:MAG: 3-isopropylmalate dehydrogenase [Alphaproteobacteria bacterium]
MAANRATLLIMAGEGIGPEVTAEARRVAEWFVAHRGFELAFEEELFGMDAYRAYGRLLREEALPRMKAADAILFGATGSLGYAALPAAARRGGSLLHIRKSLDLYANLRPVTGLAALAEASSLKPAVRDGVDLVIVRELSSGMYFGEPRGIETLADGRKRGINTHSYTSDEIERVARVAFELARRRRNHVTSVDKANVMEAGRLWRDVVEALHEADYADVSLSHMLADNCAMQLVRAPKQFDVLLTDNLFGDLLSDAAAMIAGGLGMLPSASLGPVKPDGRRAALYEPVHGSAPDIAGKGIANPLGAILSLALALEWSFGRPADARLVEAAVARALDEGARTADITQAGVLPVSTRAMGDAVLAALARLA